MNETGGSQQRSAARRPPFRRWGSLLSAFAALAGIAVYLWLQRQELLSIRLEAPAYLLLCALGMLVNISANGLVYLLVFRKLGARVSFAESFALTALSIAANLFLPLRGGAGLRAVYLKRVHDLRYTRFAASLIVFYVLSALVASTGTLMAASWLVIVEGRSGLEPILLVAAFCLIGSAATFYLPRLQRRGTWSLTLWPALAKAGTHCVKVRAPWCVCCRSLHCRRWACWSAFGARPPRSASA